MYGSRSETVSIGRASALAVLRDWLSRGAMAHVTFNFSTHAGVAFLRIVAVTEGEVRFLADDNSAEFVLLLRDNLEWDDVDMRYFSQATDGMARTLVALFPTTDATGERDRVGFAEVERPTAH